MECITDFGLSEVTLDRLNKFDEITNDKVFRVYTMEIVSDENTPKTIKEALGSRDKEFWIKSAISEVNNFLKRESWKFVRKAWVKSLGRKIIGVKWVFKIK